MRRGIRRALRRGCVLALVLGGGALALPSLAQANPRCGKVVTSNVTLSANMFCTSSNSSGQHAALFVGNNRVTINLNGFSIRGNGTISIGIDNAGDWNSSAPGSGGTPGPGTGFKHDTVENGKITNDVFGQRTGFADAGIYADHVTSMKVSNMTVYGMAGDGLELYDANTSSVTGSHFGNKNNANADGANMSGNAALTISDSTFNWNAANGIDDNPLVTGSGSQATLNHVTANHDGVVVNDSGVFVDAPVAPYLVENSTANGNSGSGFEAESNQSNTIKFNNNNAENNGEWGFFAAVFAHGTNNGFRNDASGGCHKVGGCHLLP